MLSVFVDDDHLLEFDQSHSGSLQPRERVLRRFGDRRLFGSRRHARPTEDFGQCLLGGFDFFDGGCQPLREDPLHGVRWYAPSPAAAYPTRFATGLAALTHELASVRMCAYLAASYTIVTWLTTLSRLTGIATGCLMTQRATVAGVPLRLPSDPRSSIGWQVFSAPSAGPFDELSRDK